MTLADLIARSRYSGLCYPVVMRDRALMHQASVSRESGRLLVLMDCLKEHHESLTDRYKDCEGVACGEDMPGRS